MPLPDLGQVKSQVKYLQVNYSNHSDLCTPLLFTWVNDLNFPMNLSVAQDTSMPERVTVNWGFDLVSRMNAGSNSFAVVQRCTTSWLSSDVCNIVSFGWYGYWRLHNPLFYQPPATFLCWCIYPGRVGCIYPIPPSLIYQHACMTDHAHFFWDS